VVGQSYVPSLAPPMLSAASSYSPGLTGVTLYFTTEEQGRYSPRYQSKSNKSEEKVSCSMVMLECVLLDSFHFSLFLPFFL
jgi:hypothetical protein